MKNLLKKVRKKIKEVRECSLGDYADNIGVRKATLYDFLNGKSDIKLPTLMKIITPLGMSISEDLPDTFMEVKSVLVKGKSLKKGMSYKGREIMLCFGTQATSYQGLVLRDSKDRFTLMVL